MDQEEKPQVKRRDRKRLVYLSLGIFTLFSLLLFQFFRIQIIEGDAWTKKAERQHFFYVTEPFQRGRFFSNAGVRRVHPDQEQALVIDINKYHLYVDPMSLPFTCHQDVHQQLCHYLLADEFKRAFIYEQLKKKSRSRKLAMWLDREKRDAINAWWLPYAKAHKIPRNALYFVGDYQRSYPFGKMLGQVLHTIQSQKDEQTKQAVPTGGLEYFFNRYLQGKQGKRRLMRTPRHAFETGDVIEDPENGADIYLTINPCLQAICEEEIERGVRRVKAKAGWAVMMEPRTGEILALAQYPFFFPPDYQAYFNDKQLIDYTRVKAVTDANEPASVFKAFTLATALLANEELISRGEDALFDPDEKIATSNGVFSGRSRPIRDTRVHQFLNMNMALQKSSNIYMARLMERVVKRLGNEWYRSTLQNCFGFGLKTGIELPAESPGVLPRPGKMHPNGKLEWSVPTPFSLAMGHNLQTNTIQILRAFSTFANGGYLVNPTLLRKIVKRDAAGNEWLIEDHTKEAWLQATRKRVLPESLVKRVVEALKYVTKPGGGGWRADVWGYSEAGKTGTAKKIVNGTYSSQKYCSSFIGFTPVKHPSFVLIVVIDEPDTAYRQGQGHSYYGSVSCAPVFKEIARRSLEFLGVVPDDPYGYAKRDPRFNREKADWMVETERLQEMYKKWNH